MTSLPDTLRRWTLRPRSTRVVVADIVAGAALLVGTGGLAAHFRAPGAGWSLGVSAFSPYLMLGAPLALVVLAVAREWLGTVAALVVTVVAVAVQAPLYVASTAPAHARRLVVMTANLKIGGAVPALFLDAVRRHHVDALMLQELTPQEQARLVQAGLDRLLPYHVADPRPQAEGTGLWSRYPLHDEVKRTDLSWAFVTARVDLPGTARDPLLGALHLHGPLPDSGPWQHDIRHLRAVLPALGGRDGVTVLGGDFNATPDLHQFRELLTDGWADGAEQAGAGMTRTFPSSGTGYPLIAIDHVLTRRSVATSADTVHIPGSDHRALVVTVAVPRSARD